MQPRLMTSYLFQNILLTFQKDVTFIRYLFAIYHDDYVKLSQVTCTVLVQIYLEDIVMGGGGRLSVSHIELAPTQCKKI